MEKEITVSVQIDNAISIWNENNPKKRKMNRQSLIDQLTTKINIATIQNYKRGDTPNVLKTIVEIMTITECTISELIEISGDHKRI